MFGFAGSMATVEINSSLGPRFIQTPGGPNVAVGIAVGVALKPQAEDITNSNEAIKSVNPLRFNML